MRSLLAVLPVVVGATTAFQISPFQRAASVLPPRAVRTVAAASAPTGPDVAALSTKAATAAAEQQSKKEKVPAVMDEAIFNFNKVLVDTIYALICQLYPVTGTDRDFCRFYVLETVARVPYFAYLSVMHLRETFGERSPDMSERMRTHYAEADNELHHLLIMESLGGNSSLIDRTVAQTMAFGYYWYVVAVYSLSEQAAYHLSELIEDHAYNTYDKYIADYGDVLKKRPVPAIATKYYVQDNPFLFDLFCTVRDRDEATGAFSARRPKLETLYDVFVNVRNDEREHWKTLCNLVQFDDMQAVEAVSVVGTKPAAAVAASAAAQHNVPAAAATTTTTTTTEASK